MQCNEQLLCCNYLFIMRSKEANLESKRIFLFLLLYILSLFATDDDDDDDVVAGCTLCAYGSNFNFFYRNVNVCMYYISTLIIPASIRMTEFHFTQLNSLTQSMHQYARTAPLAVQTNEKKNHIHNTRCSFDY